jgi:hypothetical protein
MYQEERVDWDLILFLLYCSEYVGIFRLAIGPSLPFFGNSTT